MHTQRHVQSVHKTRRKHVPATMPTQSTHISPGASVLDTVEWNRILCQIVQACRDSSEGIYTYMVRYCGVE